MGEVSVMPQAWWVVTPWRSRNSSNTRFGHAAPPTTVRSRLGNRVPVLARYCSNASQTVGTPSATVTRSSLMSWHKVAGSPAARPGSTSPAPTIGAMNGTPQALTWNIGTTGNSVSTARGPSTSAPAPAIACSTVDRWL